MGQIDVESTFRDDPLLSSYKSSSEIHSSILPKWLVFWAVVEGYRVQGYSSRSFGSHNEDENAIVDAERAFRRVLFIWHEQIGVDHQTTGVVANTTTPWRWFTPEKVAAKGSSGNNSRNQRRTPVEESAVIDQVISARVLSRTTVRWHTSPGAVGLGRRW